jgi:hypothetical protein
MSEAAGLGGAPAAMRRPYALASSLLTKPQIVELEGFSRCRSRKNIPPAGNA